MGFLISLALGWKWPGWAARLFGWAIPALVACAAIGAAIALIYHKGESAGGTRVQAQAEKAHAETIAEARADERKAAAVTDAIGRRVAAAEDETTALVRSKIKDIHDGLHSSAGTSTGNSAGPAAAFDSVVVRDSLNSLIVDANRSADAADAERRDDQDRAPANPDG